jgi:antitoxin (DNA-binding transcriptional repressor) of toxin-antitoxin stability system
MPTTNVDVKELATHWPEIVSQVISGAEVIVTEGDHPCAKLVALTPGQPRIPGLHLGAIKTTDDFDAPLPDDFWQIPKTRK